MIYLLGTVVLFAAVTTVMYQLLSGRVRQLAVREVERKKSVDPSKVPSLLFRLAFPFVNPLAPALRGVKWPAFREKMTGELQRAGMAEGLTVEHVLAMKILAAAVLPFLISRPMVMFRNPALFVGLTGLMFFLPDKMVADVRRNRERKIVRALPGAVDVLSLSVEAGLEFLIALQRLVERGGIGPLRDELATILNDIRLGNSRSQALKSFAQRVDIPEVSSFVSVLVQADTLGASIGTVLQSQAERMRVERFQRAEKAGARATQKILFPMVLFIFPAVLIVIIGPVVLKYLNGM
jgi:tight adherence protein C